MAEAKKAAPAPAAKAALTPAGESSDPTVHTLLARRQAALSNGDEATATAVDVQLAELGYQ